MESKISRRDFLKLSGTALTALAFRDFPPDDRPLQRNSSAFSLGRVIYSLRYYKQPSAQSEELGYYVADTVINIYQQTLGDLGTTNNPKWLYTGDGWLNSAYVQPVKNELNQPIIDVPAGGILVEVTVPYTQSYQVKDSKWKRSYRYYYRSTHWVDYAFNGTNGIVWYQVLDDRSGDHSMVDGAHMRPIKPEELAPISPNVSDKLIKVDLAKQRVTAYERGHAVFTTFTSTGYVEGTTPKGEFRVERKRPSRHMAAFEGNGADLPGVPWVCYISWTGVSLHGTYWHNNFGTPQSRGCINLTPQAALWIYRWTEPYVPPGEDYLEVEQGTRVVVF